MKVNLTPLQAELQEWRKRNFPDSGWGHHMLGVMEEVGELSHHLLKQAQGIRGSYETHEIGAKDAVGDILIYLMGVCSDRGWSLEDILAETASHVLKRDWIADPHQGAQNASLD